MVGRSAVDGILLVAVSKSDDGRLLWLLFSALKVSVCVITVCVMPSSAIALGLVGAGFGLLSSSSSMIMLDNAGVDLKGLDLEENLEELPLRIRRLFLDISVERLEMFAVLLLLVERLVVGATGLCLL